MLTELYRKLTGAHCSKCVYASGDKKSCGAESAKQDEADFIAGKSINGKFRTQYFNLRGRNYAPTCSDYSE